MKNVQRSPQKLEPEKRRVIFQRDLVLSQDLKTNWILVLNKLLQKVGIPAYIRFCRVKYSQSRLISTLLINKFNIEKLIIKHSNALIRAAKSVDKGVIGVEALE